MGQTQDSMSSGEEREARKIPSPLSQFIPYMLSSEIPSSNSGFLLIERRGTALTLKELTQEPGDLDFKL